MEATGLFIGIAALFTTCIQCFEYFKAATTLRKDFEILLLKLEIEQERFLVWGEDTGIGHSDHDELSLFDGDSKRQDLVLRCLYAIRGLLGNADELKSKYGVQPTSPVARSTDHHSLSSNALKRLRLRFGRSQDKPTILRTTKWVIHDAAKFGKLIEHLRDLINGLKKDGHGPRDTLQEKIQTDIAYMIDDIGQLRLLSEACEDDYPEWSDMARSAIDASELGTEGEHQENHPLAQFIGNDVVASEALGTRFGDKEGLGGPLNISAQIFFFLTEQCRNQETELPCEEIDLGRRSFDVTQSFIPAMAQTTRSFPGQWIGKLIDPRRFTFMDFDRYEEYLHSMDSREINDGSEVTSTGRFSAQVYLYCAPCSCQVSSALQVAWSLGQFPHLDACVRVDYRLQSSCSISSSGIIGIQSVISYVKELENSVELSRSESARLKVIDRQWLEQAVYNYEDEPQTMSESPANKLSHIVSDPYREQKCAALIILGEADYCIPLVGAPPFPPLSKGKVPRETELYRMSQRQVEGKRYWVRQYKGTYTAKPPPAKKRRLPMTLDTVNGSQELLPPAKRSATSGLSQSCSQD
ncbi:MAG: hypothetical protein Q9226_008385 [Calogaya cf. arnoldii]